MIDLSKITNNLYLSSLPDDDYAGPLKEAGVRMILNNTWLPAPRPLKQPPFTMVRLPCFDSILIPIPMWILKRGVQLALPRLEAGESVLCHCLEGRHRSVAMASCILIAQGNSAEDAMALINAKRAVADPDAWHIRRRIEKFEEIWPTS